MNATEVDFANFQYGTVNGVVFNDVDGDGVMDASEEGVAGVAVTMGAASSETDADGAFTFDDLSFGDYTVSVALPSANHIATTETSFDISVTSGSSSSVEFGFYEDTYEFRTFNQTTDLAAKAGKLSSKKGVISGTANLATALQNVFVKVGKAGATFLGKAVTDATAAKTHGWVFFKSGADLGKFYGGAHGANYGPISYSKVVLDADGTINTTKSKKYGKAQKPSWNGTKGVENVAWAEGILFNLNMTASTKGVTPSGFGNLVVDIPVSFIGRDYEGSTLIEVGDDLDSVMTYWSEMGVDALDGDGEIEGLVTDLIQPVNEAFASDFAGSFAYDTAGITTGKNGYAITLSGAATAGASGLVRRDLSKMGQVYTVQGSGYLDMPVSFGLGQNYPNPFNPATTINIEVPEGLDGAVATLKVYNMLGQEVATLLNGAELSGGVNTVSFDATNLSSGIYFYRVSLNGGEFSAMKKMVLMK